MELAIPVSTNSVGRSELSLSCRASSLPVEGEWGGKQRPLDTVPIADALETDDPNDIESPLAEVFRDFADRSGADRFALTAIQ